MAPLTTDDSFRRTPRQYKHQLLGTLLHFISTTDTQLFTVQ